MIWRMMLMALMDRMLVTELDCEGRVRLPAEIISRLSLQEGDLIAIDQLGDGTMILKRLGFGVSAGSR